MAEEVSMEQQSMIIYQLLQKRLEELRQQSSILENSFAEAEATRTGIKGLGEMAQDADILIPMGSGVFASGAITERQKLLVSVGASVVVEKDVASAGRFVDERRQEIEQAAQALGKEMEEIALAMNEIASNLQAEGDKGQT